MTLTVTDNSTTPACNSTCTLVVMVEDNTKPSITTCPPTENYEGCSTSAITSLAYSETEVTVSATDFTNVGGAANDNCGTVAVYKYKDSKSGPCPTVVTRHWTVEDACGNKAECDQTINVDDNTLPSFSQCPWIS